ncbi:MAG: hypothetical protein E6J79_01570 [Deltaproteobacteria bacterium]|nr:MAG: hypothetical protein E6J79_01570 [Deltaproteobacteria bacterium]
MKTRDQALARLLAGVAVLAFGLNVVGIRWGLPHPTGDWATDGLSPLSPLAFTWHLIHGEKWSGKYPAFHFLLLTLVQAPYVAWLKLRGEIGTIGATYPYGLAHPLEALGRLALLARLVSAAMGAAAAVFAGLTAAELFGRRAAVFAALVLLSSPVTVYYAHTTNVDIPYLCWTMIGLWLAVRVARGESTVRTFALLGAAAALAVATKDQAYACFALLPVALLWRRWQAGRLFDTGPLAALVSFVGVYAVASLAAIDPAGYLAHARQLTGPSAMPYYGIPLSVARVVRVSLRAANATASTLSWPFTVACVAGLALAAVRRVRGAEIPLAMALSYYLTFLIPILYAVPRYVLPVVAALAPFAGFGLAALWGDAEVPRAWVRRAAVGALLVIGVVRGATMDLRLLTDARYGAEPWLAAQPSGVIGTDADPSHLPRLAPTRPIVKVKLAPDGLHYPGSEPPELLVLSSARYRQYSHPFPRPERRVLMALLRGDLCYERAADFRSGALFGPRLVGNVSPHIIVLRRRRGPCEVVGTLALLPTAPPADARQASDGAHSRHQARVGAPL